VRWFIESASARGDDRQRLERRTELEMQASSGGWLRRAGVALTMAAVIGMAVAGQVNAASDAAPPAPGANGHHGPHILPYGRTSHAPHGGPKVKLPGDQSGVSAPAPAGAHLTYYGGRVDSNVQIVQVLWGTGTYLPQTTSTVTPSVSTFFQGFAGSNFMDWLDSEYNTVNNSFNGTKTNQHIGHGAFVGQYAITPSAGANGATVDDTAIQSELSAQVAAGHLPAPAHDAAGNTTTLYALFFRHGQNITMGGSVSLQPGGFCAYHNTIASSASLPETYYSVVPDLVGTTGCGGGSDFQNTTSVTSHELIETITDAEVGLALNSAPPLAWYDNANGEVADICNAEQGNFGPFLDGQTYTIQYEFSNAQNSCVLPTYQPPAPTSDFSLAASPSTVSASPGGSSSGTINTSITSGSALTVSLAVSGAPVGMTATMSPTSVTSGQSATLLITTTSSLAPGSYPLTVTGTAASISHATSLSVTVSGATPPPSSGGITNGGFESGLSGWTTAGAATAVTTTGCHSGTACAQLGSTSPTSGDSSVSQTFVAPTGTTGLSFWYRVTCPDTLTYDWATATLKDNTTGTTTTVLAKTCVPAGAWTQSTGAVTAGHSYTLTLISHDDNYAGDPTYTLYDDVTLTGATTPPPSPSSITNGGFESGLSGWTTAGAATAVTTTGCHGGTACAQLGSTSPTSGDSSVSQTFVAPTGTTDLSFWYRVTCPDTLTYDWATATLKDNTTGTTATVLTKTCVPAGAWTQSTAAVTAGHSYTLTLISHDDNYAGDPTYTLYDDVTLK
jgi:hypothetical protein